MATSSHIELNPLEQPLLSVQLTKEAATATSRVLQENHEKYHIFFNDMGFHNHIVHHLLTIYALGASPEIIERQYDRNKSYQNPPMPLEESVVDAMKDPEKFKTFLGNEKYYRDFMVYFQKEIAEKGSPEVLKEYLLNGDERADDMLVRLYSGLLHPIIHLGFGIEFKQPAIVAEALAEAAVHSSKISPLLLIPEKLAKENDQKQVESKSLVQLLDEIREDKKLKSSVQWEDEIKIQDGIMKRALEEMAHYASQFTVTEDTLERRTAEMVNAAVYFTTCAQHPSKMIKFDFFYIHSVNCSIFFSAFLAQPWLTPANKKRLLEWKGRIDLVIYTSRHCPELDLAEIENYKPKRPSAGDRDPWKELFVRANTFDDDGHAAKLVRSLAHGQAICAPYDQLPAFKIKKDMWPIIGHMVVDSIEAGKPTWVRSCGFDQAWKEVEDRTSIQQ